MTGAQDSVARSFPAAAAAAESLQSCPTLCDPRDGSPPGSPGPGALQARTLERVAISFSSSFPGVEVKGMGLFSSALHFVSALATTKQRLMQWCIFSACRPDCGVMLDAS